MTAKSSSTGLLLVGVLTLILLASGCSDADDPAAQEAVAVPVSRAVVPQGWLVQRAPGFTLAIPPEWVPRPEEFRLAPDAALEVGVPYTGQPVALPLLLGFVERERVGPLDIREKLLRLQLEQGLPPGTTFGASKDVQVAGAVDALTFDAVYSTAAGTSVLGTPVAPVTVRQRELVVETPGLPKYGLRFTAPLESFDEQLWQRILNSLVVTPGVAPPSPSPDG